GGAERSPPSGRRVPESPGPQPPDGQFRNDQLPSACPPAEGPSVSRPTRWLSAGRQLPAVAREPAERCRLLHGHRPVMHLDPAAPFEAAQRGVDALPAAPGLPRELLLAHPGPDDAVLAPRLVEQHLR